MKPHFSLRVRFLLILEVFGSCCSSFVGKHSNDDIYTHTDTWQRRLETLGRYDIGVSKISYTGTVIQLIFPISDQVPDNSVSATTFSDSDCSVDITGNDFLVPTIIYDENPDPDGTKNREVTIRYDIDPEGIQKSAVWVQDEQNQFFMNFCVSISLHSGDAETTSVSKTTETLVQLQVDLIGDFGTEMQVT